MNKYYQLLEVYDLETILEALDLEPADILKLLDEEGLLDGLSLPEPL